MRVRSHLKGVASASFKTADGTRKVHYYAWRGGPAIKDGDEFLQPGDPRFVEAYNRLTKIRASTTQPIFQTLIDLYLDSEEFQRLAPRTQADYRRIIFDRENNIAKKFGSMPLSAFSLKYRHETRGIFKVWRDALAKSSRRQADYAWVVLARIISVALDRGKVDSNPCERGGRIYRADRSGNVWTTDDEARFTAAAPTHLILPFMMALWTGQRQGDLLALTWSAYDGQHIRLRQGKTGVRVIIPVGAPLKSLMDSTPRKSTSILTTAAGRPWTPDGFRVSWRKACAKAGITDLTFHDLRGTAVTRLALAGCTVPEIATLSGHSLKDVEAILDAHYLSRDQSMAASAILKLETADNIKKHKPGTNSAK
ncbi:tyrosine-type recombinase/integrase [Xanthobacter sp. TB0136]|uniref:tyrosine-type recombinase/integrase n=1 Tax=Xanthobacter sp. TB0136 TaxID=3459177 RepID=UPI004039B32B